MHIRWHPLLATGSGAQRSEDRRMHLLSVLFVAQSFFGTLPIDGIRCDRAEGDVEHIHVNLQLFDRGKPVQVPTGVGIPQGGSCLYWLHTHSADGFIHIESPVKRSFDLGEFFDIWGPDLSLTKAATLSAPRGHHLSIWVDGKPWHGSDPRTIAFHDHETIVIQNGPPFATPTRPNWSGL
jgi:hypothetical protein